MNLKKITESLIDVFLEAGSIAKEISDRGVKITIKKDNTPVTDGDVAVDKILKKHINILTPNIPIISEETVNLSQNNEDKNFWLIDPIDGTRDYIKKKEEYTLNAALIINLKPAIGIVYAPKKERLFFSYGQGLAFEINNGNKKKLYSKIKYHKNVIALMNTDKPSYEILELHKKYNVSQIIKMSSSLKFCVIAAGEADIYIANARAFEWDIAAGHAILQHAGGSITDHNEKCFLYGKKNYKNLPLIAKRCENLAI